VQKAKQPDRRTMEEHSFLAVGMKEQAAVRRIGMPK
jgi:hypothetical protein